MVRRASGGVDARIGASSHFRRLPRAATEHLHAPAVESGSKGQGLFAARSIEEGSLIGRYNGELLSEDEYDAKLLKMVSGQGMYVMDMGNGYILVCHAGLEPQTSRPQTDLLRTRATLALDRTARTQRNRRSCATSTTRSAGQTAGLRRWWTRTTRAHSPPWP